MDAEFARSFAEDWIEAWNAHDLDRVLGHYDDSFEMSSPIITTLLGEPAGKLRGKPAVRKYWSKALALAPDLRFELIGVLLGVRSITIYYHGRRGPAAEVLHFGANNTVIAGFAYYSRWPERKDAPPGATG